MPISSEGLTVLTKFAASNRNAAPLFKHLASEEKNRFSVSARGLYYGTKDDGARVPMVDCKAFVAAISAAGLGRITKDGKGFPGIKNLEVPTREIGEVVHGNSKNLRVYAQERKARNIDEVSEAVKAGASELKIYPMRQASNISITLTINGKPVILPLPSDLNADQLSALLERLKRVEDGYDPKRNK